MPALLPLAVVPAIFVLSAFGPGFLLVRRTGWDPLEKLTASVGASLLFLYFAGFTLFAAGAPRSAHWALFAVSASTSLALLRPAARFFAAADARRALGAGALVAVWVVALLALVRGYSGGAWYGDWLEHYRRSVFFLGGGEAAATFQGYALTARPPLVNVIAAHVMALAGERFRVYQIAVALLGVAAFLPVALLARRWSPRGASAAIVAAFLMLNPLFVQNATYSWTKLPAAFFVVAGVAFYVAGRREDDPRRIVLSFALLAAGVMAHYSSWAPAAFVGGHALAGAVRERGAAARAVAAAFLAAAIVAAPWIGWAAANYGGGALLAATSTVRDRAGVAAGDTARIAARNLRDTLVPRPRRRTGNRPPESLRSWGGLRDAAFVTYQQNLPLALGSGGAALVLYEIARRRRARLAEKTSRAGPCGARFWAAFAAFYVVAGVAAHAKGEPHGLTHVALQPLVLIGVAFLAAGFPGWPPPIRALAAAGLFLDLLFGIALHFWLQATPHVPPGGGFAGLTANDLAVGGAGNAMLQQAEAAVFLGNASRAWSSIALVVALAALGVAAAALRRRLPPRPGDAPG